MQAAAMYLEIGHGMGDDVDCVGHTDWEHVGGRAGNANAAGGRRYAVIGR